MQNSYIFTIYTENVTFIKMYLLIATRKTQHYRNFYSVLYILEYSFLANLFYKTNTVSIQMLCVHLNGHFYAETLLMKIYLCSIL